MLFPDILKPYYLIFLASMIFSIFAFTSILISYYSLLFFNEIGTEHHITNNPISSEDTVSQKNSSDEKQFIPKKITIGYDKTLLKYYLKITFLNNLDKSSEIEEIQYYNKLLKPYSNWFAFCVAKKLNVKLSHIDIASIKFRMAELWNKNANIELKQQNLFVSDFTYFELGLNKENIFINDADFFKLKYIIRDGLYNYIKSLKSSPLLEINEKITKDELSNIIFDLILQI
jgi:hypothetical protein